MIAIHFGKQLPGSMYDEVQQWAIEYEMSIEDATNDCYKFMIWGLSEVNNNWQSHFDIMFSSIFSCLVNAPEMMYETTDCDGLKTPTLLFKSNYVIERHSGVKRLITSQVMKEFGEDFQEEFGLEFLGFERLKTGSKVANTTMMVDHRSRPYNSVVYLIGNKPHYYNGRNFMPVTSNPSSNIVQQ
jgi:hypothetical protein